MAQHVRGTTLPAMTREAETELAEFSAWLDNMSERERIDFRLAYWRRTIARCLDSLRSLPRGCDEALRTLKLVDHFDERIRRIEAETER